MPRHEYRRDGLGRLSLYRAHEAGGPTLRRCSNYEGGVVSCRAFQHKRQCKLREFSDEAAFDCCGEEGVSKWKSRRIQTIDSIDSGPSTINCYNDICKSPYELWMMRYSSHCLFIYWCCCQVTYFVLYSNSQCIVLLLLHVPLRFLILCTLCKTTGLESKY